MGQYYKPCLMTGNKMRWLYSHDYNNGLKLMEHSYMGNNFVNAVLSQIFKAPQRVAWMGDYAMDEYADHEYGKEPYTRKKTRKRFETLYQRAWGERGERFRILPEAMKGFDELDDFNGWYLVNHSQKTFIDLGEYEQQNKWHQKSTWGGKTEEWDMCINPLPLLTACGNGRGGGDYHDQYPDYHKVGTWAFDKIEFTDKKPDKYKPVSYSFTEQIPQF